MGQAEPGSLTPVQRFGNWLTTLLIRSIWHVSFTDLGPMRILSVGALKRLRLRDRDFGWNVEMQAKAVIAGLRTVEVPVRYRKRIGRSKITGTVRGTFLAGTKIIGTILRYYPRYLASRRNQR